MPQCKLSNCRNPATPGVKRYCDEHRQAYLKKQREYFVKSQYWDECKWSGCDAKVRAANSDFCQSHTDKMANIEHQRQEREWFDLQPTDQKIAILYEMITELNKWNRP